VLWSAWTTRPLPSGAAVGTEDAEAIGSAPCVRHVLDWPVELSVNSVKVGTRLHVPEQGVAEPNRRGLHRVFRDIRCSPNSMLQFAQGDAADAWIGSADTPGC
jgi:hypothetical protein